MGTVHFQVAQIDKLESFKFFLHFERSGLVLIEEGIQFNVFIIMKDLEMAGVFTVAHMPMIAELDANTRRTFVTVFLTGIICSTIFFIIAKLSVYYWKKTHPRRRKGEVSVNTERGETEE